MCGQVNSSEGSSSEHSKALGPIYAPTRRHGTHTRLQETSGAHIVQRQAALSAQGLADAIAADHHSSPFALQAALFLF